MAFPLWENYDCAVVSVSTDFLINSKQDALFHRIAYDCSFADCDGRNLTLGTFGILLIIFLTKVNLLYLLYSTAQKYYILHLIKQN